MVNRGLGGPEVRPLVTDAESYWFNSPIVYANYRFVLWASNYGRGWLISINCSIEHFDMGLTTCLNL